ncbi:hypothetical protein [Paenibacillus puerhi]|uniref:hypothetical protein n=1 Tax=Paenibacillus puerhi TaxID=2692622 RepID=UPI001359ED93|nr:hypothetical protein [Paenibacillus puerhi]
MSAVSLTISWENQLLLETEQALLTASTKEEAAYAVWWLVTLGYGKLEGKPMLDGIGAEPEELLRGWASVGRIPAPVLRNLRTLSQYEARLGLGELPELPLRKGTLRAMGLLLLTRLGEVKPHRDRLTRRRTGGKRGGVDIIGFL